MIHLVSFDPGVEERVRFIEETRPGDIVDRTLDRLEAGEDARDLVAAAALRCRARASSQPDTMADRSIPWQAFTPCCR